MIEQRLIRVYHCDRCHYEWLSRKPLKPPTMPPRVCPKCMSPNWNASAVSEEIRELKAALKLKTPASMPFTSEISADPVSPQPPSTSLKSQ